MAKLEGQGRVVEGLCHLLEFGEIYGVIESAHVEQDSDAMLPQGFVALLSKQSLQGHVEGCGSWSCSVVVHGAW